MSLATTMNFKVHKALRSKKRTLYLQALAGLPGQLCALAHSPLNIAKDTAPRAFKPLGMIILLEQYSVPGSLTPGGLKG